MWVCVASFFISFHFICCEKHTIAVRSYFENYYKNSAFFPLVKCLLVQKQNTTLNIIIATISCSQPLRPLCRQSEIWKSFEVTLWTLNILALSSHNPFSCLDLLNLENGFYSLSISITTLYKWRLNCWWRLSLLPLSSASSSSVVYCAAVYAFGTFVHIANYQCCFDQWYNGFNAHEYRVYSIRCMSMQSHSLSLSPCVSFTLFNSRLIDIHFYHYLSQLFGIGIEITLLVSLFIPWFAFPFAFSMLFAVRCVCIKFVAFTVTSANDKIVI